MATTKDEGAVLIPFQDLKERISTSKCPIWNYVLRQRLDSEAALDGVWIADAKEDIKCVANVIESHDRVRVYLFCRDPETDAPSMSGVLHHITAIALKGRNEVAVSFLGPDRRTVPTIKQFLDEQFQCQRTFYTPCKMFIHCGGGQSIAKVAVSASNFKIRALTQDDAGLVNSRWEYKYPGSVDMIQKMIASKKCIGLEVDGVLVAWVCQYLHGPLGMLWTEKDHRRKGYAELVVAEATIEGPADGQPWTAFVVDENTASASLFSKLNWEYVADTDFFGFKISKRAATP